MMPYVDKGAIWKDLADGKGQALVTGEVDITKPGRYILVYSATDQMGNVPRMLSVS